MSEWGVGQLGGTAYVIVSTLPKHCAFYSARIVGNPCATLLMLEDITEHNMMRGFASYGRRRGWIGAH
jgi:hypothetical protein